jgi:hypothetical protein
MTDFLFELIFADALDARVSFEKYMITGDEEQLLWADMGAIDCGFRGFKTGATFHQVPALLASIPDLSKQWQSGWKMAADGNLLCDIKNQSDDEWHAEQPD